MELTRCLEVIARDDLQRCPHWQVAFANERKDHRYYELVEDTLHPEFEYRYFVLKSALHRITSCSQSRCSRLPAALAGIEVCRLCNGNFEQ
jgi:hypothetical protein